ncbi:MAG TPA: glycerol acyltransferase, partial [Butyricimonas virosa]|nr:glycerol acyltransferase [Butyricimonas virosa]
MEETVKPIYIEQLFKSKNPKLARWIPKFVYS